MPARLAAEWVPVARAEAQLADRVAAAITDYEPDPATPAAVLQTALVRGLLDLSRQYQVTP